MSENTPQHPGPIPRGRMRLFLMGITSVTSVACIWWCFATWRMPGRFVFVPFGDVGYGFRSYAGWLAWIQFAPWQSNPDYVKFEVPWIAVILIQIVLIVSPFHRWRTR